ncbi:MAG TPA: pyridoxamine 5'-phosphate oxidase family protein [Pyrinomonadaceae bacterium]|nr:pyridoxamine 5'-phosphate oxidase family protein [Pyrinomonadaceae bacterium]
MTIDECIHALKKTKVGRLACARDNQPYLVPINFAFDGTYLYGFTTLGQKIEWMRSNPLVCFEMDEVKGPNEWMSVIVFGRYEELPDQPKFQGARIQAHRYLQERIMWWEPAYISQQHRDLPHSLIPIFYRIHIEKITGHRATFDEPSPSHNAESCSPDCDRMVQVRPNL